MTLEETRQQKAAVLLENHEAQEQLNAIKIRAERIGNVYVKIGEAMKSDPAQLFRPEWKAAIAPFLVANTANYNERDFLDALSYERLTEIATDYKQASARVSEVGSQMKRLGLSEG
jgi:hypothetical protein